MAGRGGVKRRGGSATHVSKRKKRTSEGQSQKANETTQPAPVVSQPTNPVVSQPTNARKSSKTKRLPNQYEFTPRNPQPTTVSPRSPVPGFNAPTELGVRNFPPPISLFPNAPSHSGASPTSGARTLSPPVASTTPPQHRTIVTPQPRGSSSRQPSSTSLPPGVTAIQPRSSSPLQHTSSATNHHQSTPTSSQAQNDHFDESSDEDEEDYEEEGDGSDGDGVDEFVEPRLLGDVLDALHQMLIQPGREDFTTLLSPRLEPGTTW